MSQYRNLDLDWHESEDLKETSVEQPVLFIGGGRDSAVLFGSLEPMKRYVPNLWKIVLLPDGGHLVQMQYPDVVNAEILDFLGRNTYHGV